MNTNLSKCELAIVIPAYKATFLRDTLESIACQTDRRFRVYIGDDCSPHDLKSIVDDFTDRIPITYKRFESNLGGKDLVGQWERCIAMTEDESYIWLFSDDDVMGKDCVASFNSLPKDIKDISLCHYDIKIIDDLNDGRILDVSRFPKNLKAGEYLKAKLEGQIISYVVEFIFPRDLYEKVGGFRNYDLAWGSDFMTWLKMSANCRNGILTISTSAESMVYWRQSNENISPDLSRSIVKRKIKSWIENAVFIKSEMIRFPEKYHPIKYSFRWVRFPLGEIYRNKYFLTIADCITLIYKYFKQVIISK